MNLIIKVILTTHVPFVLPLKASFAPITTCHSIKTLSLLSDSP